MLTLEVGMGIPETEGWMVVLATMVGVMFVVWDLASAANWAMVSFAGLGVGVSQGGLWGK